MKTLHKIERVQKNQDSDKTERKACDLNVRGKEEGSEVGKVGGWEGGREGGGEAGRRPCRGTPASRRCSAAAGRRCRAACPARRRSARRWSTGPRRP